MGRSVSASTVANNKTKELIVPLHIFKSGMLQARQLAFSEQSCWVSRHSFIFTSSHTRFNVAGVLFVANSNSHKGKAGFDDLAACPGWTRITYCNTLHTATRSSSRAWAQYATWDNVLEEKTGAAQGSESHERHWKLAFLVCSSIDIWKVRFGLFLGCLHIGTDLKMKVI